ncbi:hypothetical protein Pelo_13346 [Pelomyxa schiedti]|nr:hypothetical protein Pelo_13346 [Pelomyxa schiedti]
MWARRLTREETANHLYRQLRKKKPSLLAVSWQNCISGGEIVDPDLGEIDAQVIVDSGGEISLQEILPGDALVVQTNCGSRIQTDTVIHGPSSIIVEVKASFPRPCVVRWSTKTECFIAFLERHPELQHFKKYVVVLFDGSRSPSAPHPQCSGQTQESRSTLRAKVKKFWESVLYCAVYTSRVELMHWPCEVLEKRLTKMGKLVDTTATEAEPERVEVLKKVPKRKKKGKNNPKGAHKSRNSRNTNKKCSC